MSLGLPPLRRYVALGDSISIDEYPGLDWQERQGLAAPAPGLGAASLLRSNADGAWPQFRGLDLETHFGALHFESLATDGGTTTDVLDIQIPQLEGHDPDQSTLVTLTVGGNDLLQALSGGGRLRRAHADRILASIEEILDRLARLYWRRVVLLGTGV